MKRCDPVSIAFILLLAASTLSLYMRMRAPYAYGSAVIWTDKPDYSFWETVTIFGSDFEPSTNIVLTITRPDFVVETHSTTSSSSGNFIYYYMLDGMLGTYTVTATDGTNSASTTFTESEKVDWVQGHDDINPKDGVIDTPMVTWHTGDINEQNSILTEGNIVPPYPENVPGHVDYRAIIDGLAAGNYVLTIQYEFTKGGIVAFDFLTTNYGVTDSNLQTQLPNFGSGFAAKIAALVLAGPSTATFQHDTFPLPGSLGSGTVQDRQGAHDTVFAIYNPRTMKLYGATITGVTQGPHTGSATGDSDATVTISFYKSTDDTEPVMATWGSHLGIGTAPPAGYGPGKGAGSVSGAPFHMSLDSLVNIQTGRDILGGRRDRSVQIGAITPPSGTGTIAVQKITMGGVDTFWFDGAGIGLPAGFDYFSITTTAPGVAASTGFANVNPGTYTVTEQALTGWDFTGITINDPDGESGHTGSTVTLNIDSGEIVTVTFTNTQRGKIIVDTITVPAHSSQSFTFTTTGSGYLGFSLTDDAAPNDSGWLVPGTYTVTEEAVTGWDLTSVTLDGVASLNGASISLAAGQIRYVNFTNTQRGKIIVDTVTVPGGSSQSFDFSLTGGPDGINQLFSLTDADTPHDSDWIKPGTYAASETVPTGWVNSAVCSDGSPLNAIVLDPSETITATFTNTKSVPVLYTVAFYTIPNNIGASIKFDSTTYMDGQSGKYAAGPYTVIANAPTGWSYDHWGTTGGVTISSPAQVNGDGTITAVFIQIAPPQCTVCDFVWKDLDLDGIQDVGEPGFPGVTVKIYDSSDNLVATTTTNGNGLSSFTVDPGSYYLEFVPPSGYVLTVQDQGADDTKDSDPNPTTCKTGLFTVLSGQTDGTQDAGMYATALPPPVGGEWVPINKFSLLAPWISLASLIAVVTISFVYVERKKKQRE